MDTQLTAALSSVLLSQSKKRSLKDTIVITAGKREVSVRWADKATSLLQHGP
jgi:hypothetical protein